MGTRNKALAKLAISPEWSFDEVKVASAFDAHVREQLPWYDLATGATVHLIRHYLPKGGVVVDVGASTGNIGRALARVLEARGAYLVSIEASDEMAKAYVGPERGRLVVQDATTFDFEAAKPDVVVLFLVMMFVPVAKRADLFRSIVRAVRPGGAVVLVDKVEPRPGYLGTVLYRLTLAAKHEAGATADEVMAKELSLGGVQRPLKEADLMPGFVEWFRFGDFAGYVCEC